MSHRSSRHPNRELPTGWSALGKIFTAAIFALLSSSPPLAAQEEITLDESFRSLSTDVTALATHYGVRPPRTFEHPLDNSAHLLTLLKDSTASDGTPHGTRHRIRLLGSLVGEMQAADRRGLPVSETYTRDLLGRARELVDRLSLQTLTAAEGSPAPFLHTACSAAQTIHQVTLRDSTFNRTSDGNASCGSSADTADLWFRFVAPETETLTFEITFAEYDAVLSLHSACPGTVDTELACANDTVGNRPRIDQALTAGQEVFIRVSGVDGANGSFTLMISSDTRIAGFVTDETTGAPIPDVRMDLDGRAGSTFTDPSGQYRFSVGANTEHTVQTQSSFGDEIFDDIPCEDGCSTSIGTDIRTIEGVEVRADFALLPLASVSGSVTEAGTGAPVAGHVTLLDLDGRFAGRASIEADGTYRVEGLEPGSFRVETATDHIDQRWRGHRCEGTCASEVGDLVRGVQGRNTPGIDFVLDTAGSIQGTVTDAVTDLPIEGVTMQVRSRSFVLDTVQTAADGSYSLSNLTTGDFEVSATHFEYLDSSREPIAVTEGFATSGIDFVLDRAAILRGVVRHGLTGAVVEGIRVQVLNNNANPVRSDLSAADGGWEVGGLDPGSYVAKVEVDGFAREFFDDVDCGPFCRFSSATPIILAANQVRTGIDFSLLPVGTIEGRVTDSFDGSSVEAFVRLFSDTGFLFRFFQTDGTGLYSFPDLEPATYFVVVAFQPDYISQAFSGVFCPFLTCDPTSGTPIALSPGETIVADLAMDPRPVLTGRVTGEVTGSPLSAVPIELVDPAGNPLEFGLTEGDGAFRVTPDFVGAAKIRTRSTTFDDELYEEIPCEGGCDLTLGTTLNLTGGTLVPGLDFTLTGCGSPEERTVRFFLFKNPAVVEACRTVITGEDVTVGAGGDVTFRAGESIVLGDGFAVLTGGSFKAEIVPELSPAP